MLELPIQPWTFDWPLCWIQQRSSSPGFGLLLLKICSQAFGPPLLVNPQSSWCDSLIPIISYPRSDSSRNTIGQRLQSGFQAPMAIQLLIVNFLYSPPGLLTIQNPQANLPGWLLSDYQSLYEGVPAAMPVRWTAFSSCCLSSNDQPPATHLPTT